MCFSATASFTAGAVLSATGVVTLSETKSKKEWAFASVPLLFGIQQIIEGAVWLSLSYGATVLNQFATYGFLFFGYLFWPVFLPFSIGLLEVDIGRKRIIYGLQFVGILVSLYLLYFLISHTIVSQVVNKSILYTEPHELGVLPVVLYWMATCVSCFFSSHRIINVLGGMGTIALALSYYYYTVTYVSVWCFFAAVLSILVYLYFRNRP